MGNLDLTSFLLWCLGAFLAGSIPFGLILVKLAGKGDVRSQGSGNIGATNVMRSGGKGLGILTLILDAAKGFVPVFLAKRAGLPAEALSWIAVAATAGHMFTPWLKFQGGKGVATALGAVLGYHPAMVLPSLGAFALVLGIFRYVSLASIVAALVLIPTALGLFGAWACLPFLSENLARYGVAAWVLLPLLVVRRHSANIQRLLNGTESKLWGGKGKP
ncbi:MAG: glycerol-3-phosphate 1-O-acyltransferase PlsY [Firmicutes bacterium]|nr:glycerol-3-phosphate 1-O-acyltransferase PlsY [Bacillota bacterium]